MVKNTREGKGRSRGGCVTCKSRRKKCDETHPICGACHRLGLPCQYTKKLYWHNSNQIKYNGTTKLFDPLTIKYMITVDAKEYQLLQTFQLNQGNPNGDDNINEHLNKNRHLNIFNYTNRSIHEDQKFQQMIQCDNQTENQLFDYYVEVISKKKVFSDNQLNEFRSVIIPNSIISPSLFQSIIALSASDLIRKNPQQQDYYSSVANKYKNEAINSMYDLLDNPNEENLNEIVVSVLMLCSLEIGEYGNDRWINYLKQSCLIFHTIKDEIIIDNEVLLFCYRYFTIRYILLLTTLTGNEFNSFIGSFPMKLIPQVFDDYTIDYMFGCCPKLLQIIYEITMLKNNPSEITSIKVTEIFNQLEDIQQIYHLTDQLEQSNDRLIYCSRIYLNAIQLYFQNSFEININMEKSKPQLINESIRLFNIMLESKDLNLFPTWTLFIMGIIEGDDKLRDDQLRTQMLEIFEKLEQIWPQSSVTITQKAIELVWKNNDMNGPDGINKINNNAEKNDWRNILDYMGFKLALI